MPQGIHHRDDTGSLRRCIDVAATLDVEPLSNACQQCREHGDNWVELWLCLSCGWVACSDNSLNQHAKAHYEETDHPIAVSLQDGLRPRWCYIHALAV